MIAKNNANYSQSAKTFRRRGLRSANRLLLLQLALAVLASMMLLPPVSGKTLDDGSSLHNHNHHQRRSRIQRDSDSSQDLNVREQCNGVRDYFESIDIKLNGNYNEKGAICGGNCCSNNTEIELRQKAKIEFERLLHHHTKSLRGILESTASLFQNHVLELASQSENKTLNVFSQVYRRMVPLSSELIRHLYAEIINHLRNSNSNDINSNASGNLNGLEEAIHKFFVNLFPVAYHQAVHLNKDNYGELHEDYINCLKHTYDELQPFGTIPKEIKHNLLQSVQTATIFMSALSHSAEVLSQTVELYGVYLTPQCEKQLLKMSYCPSCNGLQKAHVKTCYSYCMNVMRGCSAQYTGTLDSPWSTVVEAIDNLVETHIRSDSGIMTTIKQLDGKLSEAIMRAMENGPELEKKVKKTCGTPKLLPTMSADSELRPLQQHNLKWVTPPDAEILHFLTTIDKSKDFYSNIVNTVCQDEEIQAKDRHCWTGDRVGDYTHMIMAAGMDTQRYNPEVPVQPNAQLTELTALVDKLLKIRKSIENAIPSTMRSYSDIQSDMARHDEEGSGHMIDDVDDEEYSHSNGSGDGSGDGATPPPFDSQGDPTVLNADDTEKRSSVATVAPSSAAFVLSTLATTLVTIILTSRS